MLRSAATPNRTEVQSSPAMKQTTIRQHPPDTHRVGPLSLRPGRDEKSGRN